MPGKIYDKKQQQYGEKLWESLGITARWWWCCCWERDIDKDKNIDAVEREKEEWERGRASSVSNKKSPNVYKSCPKMILQEKFNILTPLKIP